MDEKGFVRASHEFYSDKINSEETSLLHSRNDVEGIAGFVALDYCMDDLGCSHDEIRLEKCKTGRVILHTGFNARYGWAGVAMDWFESVTPFLADNSWMTIYGEGNDVVRMRVKNGVCRIK